MACRPQYISPNVAQPWHLRFLRGLLLDALQSLRREPLCIFGSRVFQSQGYTHTVNWCVGENDGAISADEVCGALDYSRKALAREARRVHFARVKIARKVQRAFGKREMRVLAELPMEAWIAATIAGKPIDVRPVVEKWCATSDAFVDRRLAENAAKSARQRAQWDAKRIAKDKRDNGIRELILRRAAEKKAREDAA